MKSLTQYISEKLVINKNKTQNYKYFPKTKKELREIIEQRIEQEGNKADLNNIDTSKITDMSSLFEDTDFNATLMVCLQTPLGIMCGHIGDGRMGYLSQDNIWGSMMKPHKGEEANQTIFLQNNWTKPRIPILKISGVYVPETRILLEQPKAIILMSDGCERSAWQCSIYDSKNGKGYC